MIDITKTYKTISEVQQDFPHIMYCGDTIKVPIYPKSIEFTGKRSYDDNVEIEHETYQLREFWTDSTKIYVCYKFVKQCLV